MDYGQVTAVFPQNNSPYSQVCSAQAKSGSFTLVNSSLTTTAFLSANFSGNSSDTEQAIPLPPMAQVTLDGTKDTFCFTQVPGTSALLYKIPSGTAYTSGFVPGGNTQPISQQGSLTADAFTIAAATTKNVITLVDVSSFPTYELSTYVYCTSQTTVGASLTVPILLTWYDDLLSGIPVYQEEWDIWVGNNSGTNGAFGPLPLFPIGTAFGVGPNHGRYLTVTMSELGGAVGLNCRFVNIYGSNRIQVRSNWRQQPPQMNSGFTQVTGGLVNATTNNVLMNIVVGNIGNAVTLFIPMGLYSGSAWLRFQIQTSALANSPCLAVADPRLAQMGSLSAGSGTPGVITADVADTTDHQYQVILPRCPTYMILHNSAAAQTYGLSLTAQEVA